jgi:hypothetical protein
LHCIGPRIFLPLSELECHVCDGGLARAKTLQVYDAGLARAKALQVYDEQQKQETG